MTTATSTAVSTWWRDSVVYQVYVRSFADGNGGGQGDINGLRSRLGHIASLGVDAIWLNPWYLSPLADGGYDVADYRKIEPRYGTLADAEALIEECHELGIRVIADLVPNHTSREHQWFQEALASPPGDPSRDRYIFRPGQGADGNEPPNNWQAVFGGSTWEQVDDGEWYLHIFDTSQPDLNWEHPEVRDEFDAIIRFWLDRGIDGLRIDVAHGMIKDLDFPDLPEEVLGNFALLDGDEPIIHPFWDRDGVHEINRRWRAILDEYDDRMMVAEAWVHSKHLPLYLRPDEYHQAFNFDLLETPWRAAAFSNVITTAVTAANAIGATTTWVLSNHDVMRHATRYGLPNEANWRRWPLDGPTRSSTKTSVIAVLVRQRSSHFRCQAPPISTRAKNWACPRPGNYRPRCSTTPRGNGPNTPRRGETVAGYLSRGKPPGRHLGSAMDRHGCLSLPPSVGSRCRPKTMTQSRLSLSTGRPSRPETSVSPAVTR